jgi:hypothetical protein
MLAIAIDHWLSDELAALGTDLEDRESGPDEDGTYNSRRDQMLPFALVVRR